MNTTRTLMEFVSLFHKELKEYYPKEEIDAIFFLIMNDLLCITKEDIRTGKYELLRPEQADALYAVVDELKTHRPIQYILGFTEFYGCKIQVNKNVLIPRPETEELVDWILSETRNSKLLAPHILDIGTGSGCIAIALKKNLPEADVSALDISKAALLVAKGNATLNQTEISFCQADILHLLSQSPLSAEHKSYQLIVSNPPYICVSERGSMNRNVLNYEPPLALFVNDNNPLLFYEAIAMFASRHLLPFGKLYLEINEAFGKEVKKLLEEKGFRSVEIKRDMSGKDRIASAEQMKHIP